MTEPMTSPPLPLPPVSDWKYATVEAIRAENPHVRTVRLAVPDWIRHLPGQHYMVRLTAEDGYAASRSYSIGSPPEDEGVVELTVDRLPDGEVSPYLHDELRVGDHVEVRGPIGGYFVWQGASPVLFVAGGSGVVPTMAMLRHRRATCPDVPARLLFSVRTPDELLYADELGPETTVLYTRRAPADCDRPAGRVGPEDVAAVAFDAGPAYVCGSTGFVEAAARLLVDAGGYTADRILIERYGATS